MTFKEYYKEPVTESLLQEGAILDWFKDNKNRPIVKKLMNELGLMGLFATSPPTMSYYVNKFLSDNYPNLGSDIVNKIAEYVAKNPQILDWFK